MMKQPKEEVHYKTEEVEGPPLDYGFRNIRKLAGMNEVI